MNALDIDFSVPPHRLTGVVVGALLNDPAQILALGAAVNEPPYKGVPQAPVLEVKPRHTLARAGDPVIVPTGFDALEVGASLGIVIGRTACRMPAAQALEAVAGYLIAGDFSLPLPRHYRPSVRLKARDGFCTLSAHVVPAIEVPEPDALDFEVSVDGQVLHRASTAGRVRGVARLIADVSEFMTLQPGDLLLLGRAHGAPLARAGQAVSISFASLGRLANPLLAEAAIESASA